MSRPVPRLPDTALLGPAPFGDRELGALLRSSPLVVALSGGADSVALLTALVRLRQWLGAESPFGILAVHVHHGIRGAEADLDARFAEEAARAAGVEFRLERVDVPAAEAETGESTEMAARRLRHAVLAALVKERGAVLATGHTLDDQIELLFLRLARGAGLHGLGGMAPRSVVRRPAGDTTIVRPLLGVRHRALEEFLRAEGIAWCEDSTNASDEPVRNRIRHHVVPALEKALGDPFFETAARTMSVLREDDAFLEECARRPEAVVACPSLSRRRIARWLFEHGVDPESVSLVTVDRIRELEEKGLNGEVPVGGHARVRLVYGRLELDFGNLAPTPLPKSDVFRLPEWAEGVSVFAGGVAAVGTTRLEKPPRAADLLAGPFVCTVSAAAVAGRRLVVRAWNDGLRSDGHPYGGEGLPLGTADRISPAGEGMTKKLSDVFTSCRVPRTDRARIRLLADADSGEILWLPGYAVAEAVAGTDGEPLWKLTL